MNANGDSRNAVVSANGRYVVFLSKADNLVPGDTNQIEDVFVRDLEEARTVRVSVSSSGVEQNNGLPSTDDSIYASESPAISADGRYVAFSSGATNLVLGDDNGALDVFLRDLVNNETILVSSTPGGEVGSGESRRPSLSADGRCVAFDSTAPDLVEGDRNRRMDVFIRSVVGGTTRLASRTADGSPFDYPSRSAVLAPDASSLGFISDAKNRPLGIPRGTFPTEDWFVVNLRTEKISFEVACLEVCGLAALSGDGRILATADWTPGPDTGCYVFDRASGRKLWQGGCSTQWISMSPDGRFVGFWIASDLYVPDQRPKRPEYIDGISSGPKIFDVQTGRFVAVWRW